MTAWRWSFNGLSFGEGTGIDVILAEGLEDLPPMRFGDIPRAGRHGEISGGDLAAGRSIIMELEIVADDSETLRSLLEEVKAATAPTGGAQPLTFQHGAGPEQQVMVRPRRRIAPVDVPFSLGFARIMLELHASDPLIYSATEHQGSTGFPTGGVGRTYNLEFPRVYGAAGSGGSIVLSNDGTVGAPWQATITGPWVNPTIRDALTGDQLRLSISLGPGDVLELDSTDESVFLGSAHRLNAVLPGSVWPQIRPGSSEWRIGGASGSGVVSVRWRDAWL